MYKYKKEIEELINIVKKDNDYFKKQKDIKINELSIISLENKMKKIQKLKEK